MIMGWCGTTEGSKNLGIWELFQTSKRYENHQRDLTKGVETWSEVSYFKVSKSVYFTELQMKDIVDLQPAPGDFVAVYLLAEKGENPSGMYANRSQAQGDHQCPRVSKKSIQGKSIMW